MTKALQKVRKSRQILICDKIAYVHLKIFVRVQTFGGGPSCPRTTSATLQAIIKLSLKTVHKIAQQYTPNILDCKKMFISSIVIVFLSQNLILGGNLSKADISAFFHILGKLSLSILHFLKLSVILRNYR